MFKIIYNMDKAKDKQDRQTDRRGTNWLAETHEGERGEGRGRYRENMLNMTLDPFLSP